MQIDIIGVPIDLGADRRGVDMGPSAIRYANLHQKLEAMNYALEDKGNIEVPIQETCQITDPKLKYIDCIIPMGRRVAGAVATSLKRVIFHWCWAATIACLSVRSVARPGKRRLA